MPQGLFRKKYVAFLYRFLNGFVEDNPDLHKKKRRKPRVRRHKQKPMRNTQGPRFRVRVKAEPLASKISPASLWQFVGGNWIKVSGQPVNQSGPYKSIMHTQDWINPGPPYRNGGPFTSVKVDWQPAAVVGIGTYTSPFPIDIGNGRGSLPTQYRGGFYAPNFTSVDFSDQQYASKSFLFSEVNGIVPPLAPYHPLIDQLRPKLNAADIGQSLAEIAEVPRMMRSTARDFHDYWKFIGGNPSSSRLAPKGLADSFVGTQFGWAPFVRDVVDVCNLIVNYDKILSNRTAKNGKWDHRRRVLFESNVDTLISKGDGMKCSPDAFYIDLMMKPSATWTKRFQYTKRETFRVWGTGDYRYYRPEFDMSQPDYDSGLNQIRRLSTLLGTNISPSLLWKITPWTWLVDWFTSTGSMISAISAAGLDNVVSKNVFLMLTHTRQIVLTQELNLYTRPTSFEFVRNITSKQRGHALTPFQFGLLPTSLSPKQWSILGALGISKFL